MPRNPQQVAQDAVARAADAFRRIDGQRNDAKLAGGRAMLKAIEAGVPRSKLKDLWKTSYSEVDRMVARARAER
jgi:hypothetical protein